jgi:hypothetical protein
METLSGRPCGMADTRGSWASLWKSALRWFEYRGERWTSEPAQNSNHFSSPAAPGLQSSSIATVKRGRCS